MTTILICTVGGSHEPIVRAIENNRPDHVCFVCSEDDEATSNKGSYVQIIGKGNVIVTSFRDDKPTLPNIPAQTGLVEKQFELLKVYPDDFDDVYRKVSEWLVARDRQGGRIIANYTGGTKTMSAALVAAALDHEGVELQLVTGNRANLVKVASGCEAVVPASVEATRFRRRLDLALVSWSRFAYEETAAVLESMEPHQGKAQLGEYQRARDLSYAFAAWDRFDHGEAHRIISQYRPRLGPAHGKLLSILDSLNNKDSLAQTPLRLFDLWRNAQRRAEQRRFDDAVARLYRLLEWSAQWLLYEHAGIETKDIPADKVPKGMNLVPNREGKLQAGLANAWALAAAHCGGAVAEFWNNERARLLDYLHMRNLSILAHGFEPLGEGGWRPFAQWIEDKLLPLLLEYSRKDPYRIHELPGQLPQRCAFNG